MIVLGFNNLKLGGKYEYENIHNLDGKVFK